MADLAVTVADIVLKNPVMAGSGEATMSPDGLRAALDAGAAAVVAKSWNGSPEAARQLLGAEYVLLSNDWTPLPWGPAPRSASLFCRSGLPGPPFEEWAATLLDADRYAASCDAYVVASLIVGDPVESGSWAKELEGGGLRWLELNLGAPHAEEGPPGAIRAATEPGAVADLVRPVREAVSIPLTVKLSAAGDVAAAAAAAREAGADAVCVAGRHLAFIPDLETRRPVLGTFGAIGGAWALPLTLRWIARARQRLGPNVPLIGTNGARDGRDVARFLLAGASAVQMTSAVITDGPSSLTTALAQLEDYLDDQRVSASAIIGEAADRAQSYAQATHRKEQGG